MRIPHTSKNPTVVIARVASSAVKPTPETRATGSVTLVPAAEAYSVRTAPAGRAPESYHGESGFAHADGPNAIITSLAAVRGYAAQLASYARESERVGRILDIVG